MLYQVLQLTPDQINALPPAERDAIQQLVGSRSSSLARFGRLTPTLFLLCSFVPLSSRFRALKRSQFMGGGITA